MPDLPPQRAAASSPASGAQALVYEGPEQVGIREFPLPDIGADDLLVEVVLAGVDGSEVHMLRGEMRRLNEIAPVILGDEIVGRVAEIGPGAAERRGLAVGDLVIVEARWPCDECWACTAGHYYLCEKAGQGEGGFGYGWISCSEPPHLWGGYASHVFVPREALVYPVPEGMGPKTALICGSVLANSYRWTKMAGIELDSNVVIIGPGPQGIGCALATGLRGGRVLVVGLERDQARLDAVAALGADDVFALTEGEDEGETVAAIQQLATRPIDIVIEASGAAAAKDLALSLVRPMGTITNISVPAPARVPIDWFKALLKEVTIVSPFAHPHAVTHSLRMGSDLLARGIDPGSLVSHVFPLAEAERALRTAAYEFDERPIKVAIDARPTGADTATRG